MIQAVLFVLVMIVLLGWPSSLYLLHQVRRAPFTMAQQALMAVCFVSAAGLSTAIWLMSMRSGVIALRRMSG
jgi:hypothetical protein